MTSNFHPFGEIPGVRRLKKIGQAPSVGVNSGPSGCRPSPKAPIAANRRKSRSLPATTQEWRHDVGIASRVPTFDRNHKSRSPDRQLAGNRNRSIGSLVMMFLGPHPRNIITEPPTFRSLLPANCQSRIRELWPRSNVASLATVRTLWPHSCVVTSNNRDARVSEAMGALDERMQPLGPLLAYNRGLELAPRRFRNGRSEPLGRHPPIQS